ncbi:MAG: glycosyltransferase family 4 protein [Candidatus Aenigmarchaeota archaeon]|nr:glycosyltransferase family 4 protein [Candidatus Aenigmarchaeota archaeon]
MKITLVTHSMYPDSIGGRERYVYYLADALGKKGHQVKVFTCTNSFHSKVKKYRNFTVYYFPSIDIPLKSALYRIPFAMVPRLLKDDSEIIHAQDMHHFTTFVSSVSARAKNKSFIVTEHGYPPMEGLMKLLIKVYDRTLLKFIEKISFKIIGVSNFISTELEERYKINGNKITTVHNAIPANYFVKNNFEFREKYSLKDKRIILGVGRLTKEKGFQYLIMAFKKISKKFPSAVLVLIGPYRSYKNALDRSVKRLRLTGKVIFTGPLGDDIVKSAISCCEMVVIPSLYEPFPFVPFEALRYGKPVIASATGGLSEIFVHGINGLLVKPGDYKDLEQKIELLLSDKKMRTALIQNSDDVLQRFNWRSFLHKMENIYEKTSV